jgi:hypothetical protein
MPDKRKHRVPRTPGGFDQQPPGTVLVVFDDASGIVRGDGSADEREALYALLRSQIEDVETAYGIAAVLLERGLTLVPRADPKLAADPRAIGEKDLLATARLVSEQMRREKAKDAAAKPRGASDVEPDDTADAYDYRASGFVPDDFNSLRLSGVGQTRSLDELERARQSIREALRQLPYPGMVDTDVILYDGGLYIVGGYIRHLMADDK